MLNKLNKFIEDVLCGEHFHKIVLALLVLVVVVNIVG